MQPPTPPPSPPRRSLLRRALNLARRKAAAGAAALARARARAGAERLARLRALALDDPAGALLQVRRVRRLRPGARLPAEAEALLTARLQGWAAAAPRFAALARRGPRPAGAPSAAALLRPPEAAAGLDLALPARDRPPALPRDLAGRVVIYTAAFGDDPPPAPLLPAPPGLRCLLLTDRELAVTGWETRRTAPAQGPGAALLQARIRGAETLAAAAPEAEASLFLDPAMRITGNLDTLLARWLWPQDLAMWRHPEGRDWREAIEARLTGDPPADPAALVTLAAACTAAALPLGTGACDSRVIWRRHRDTRVAALMAAWWERAAEAPETADAALAALLADPAARFVRPAILPAALGPAGDSLFFAAAPGPAPLPPPRARPPAAGPLPVAFLYAEQYAASASTFLRMGQLAEIVAEHYPERFAVTWTSADEGLRDQVVVLAKGSLQTLAPEAIAALRARNAAVIGAWDDLTPDAARMAALDASMTLSHRQTLDFARRFPATPAFHVTHHVNRLVRPCVPPADRLRTGYFGELANTVRPAPLARLVELVGINTSRVEVSWIDRLPEFNCHWTIRQRRAFDGAKPFLKGFLAARCGAVVVASREDEDAELYLGDDYPFFVRSLEPADLEADMVGFATAFGGPDWRLAQAIMGQVGARSSDAVVAAEFRAMIEAVAG